MCNNSHDEIAVVLYNTVRALVLHSGFGFDRLALIEPKRRAGVRTWLHYGLAANAWFE